MPVLNEALVEVEQETIQVVLDPAQANFVDLALLDKASYQSGLDPWVERTAAALSPERRELHHAVISGLYYGLQPRKRYNDFNAYLDDLGSEHPQVWVDRLLEAYRTLDCFEEEVEEPSQAELLADFDRYLDFLRRRFKDDFIDMAVERQAHAWLNDPPAMQETVIRHLRTMWEQHLAPAWQSSLPIIEDCLHAFRETEWPQGTPVELAEWITGHELKPWLRTMVENAEYLRFVPSAHLGPYLSEIKGNGTLWLVFGARLPEGASLRSPALSRSELMVKLNALADENRLHILNLLVESEELCAQDIIEVLDLSQSSASRHLRQLTANGYVLERRQESAKCYRLNPDQLRSTVRALEAYFGLDRQ